ncbi:MAG: BolA family transcriptional regulator [Proteobacteria bacterium]|nr:BolA family transcriptional regulator [Pseudomonadota bacterium]|tara:strand:+ start:863 stop:1099 length:237 start_codon:yes stop_codon:yes gene_type:complete
MLTPETVKSYIEQSLACEFVDVKGDGQHFEAVIVSEVFEGKNTLKQHQIVYNALGDKMRTEIHALSMRTFTPEKWKST